MTTDNDDGAEPLTLDDLRRLDARVAAWLQEINARLVLNDGRFAAMTDRINQADRRADAVSARIDARLHAIDRRFDAAETRIDLTDARIVETRDQLLDALQVHNAWNARHTLIGMGFTALATIAWGALTLALVF